MGQGDAGMQKRLFYGMGANFLGQLINLAARILLVPLFLLAWGVDLYGEWLLLSSMVAYLSLTDLGAQNYVANRLTQAFASQDIPLFCRILHTGLAFFIILPTAVFSLFLAIIYLYPPASLLKVSLTGPTTVFGVLAIMALQFAVSLPEGLLIRVYQAVGLLPRGVMLANLMQALVIILVAAGLLLKFGILGIALLQFLPFVIVLGIALYDLNKRFPHFGIFSWREAEFALGLTFIKPSLHFLLIQLSQVFTIQGMVLIVGIILGPVQVVVFATMRTIVNLIRSFFDQLVHAAWPELTRLDSQQEADKFLALFRGVLRSTLFAAMVFITVFHFYGGTIYQIWLRKTVAYDPTVMDLFLLYMAQWIFWLTLSYPLVTTNRHHGLAKMLAASAGLNLVLAYGGGHFWGLPGVVLGMIAGDLILPFWMVPFLLSRHMPQFSPAFFRREMVPYILSLGFLALVPWLAPVLLLMLAGWWVCCLPGYLLEAGAWERIRRLAPFNPDSGPKT
jgi:O-antigen/teichoic acid export membrane protein